MPRFAFVSAIRRRSAVVVTVGLILLTSVPALAATRVMILPFEAPSGPSTLETLGPGTMDSLVMALKRLPEVIVPDRATISQAIEVARAGLSAWTWVSSSVIETAGSPFRRT
jgi:TolB-like protein